MNIYVYKILKSFAEFIFLGAITITAPAIVFVDSEILCNGVSEESITEITQEVLILFSAIIFYFQAWRNLHSRGFLAIVGGLFACMFIRELDFLFDLIHHGFWRCPAILIAATSIACAVKNYKSIIIPLATYTGSKSWVYVVIGLLIVIVFSRIFGSGQLFWGDIMGNDYKSLYKTIIQEGLELYGYAFIFYGSCIFRVHE